ncbi:hypothetical protein V2G26_016036 [Clonostachys chloroleuca]
MEAVSEQSEDRPSTDGTDPKESFGPPSTAGSLRGASINDTENVQRLIGIGVMKLNSIVKQQEEMEQLMGIWGPSSRLGNEKLPLDEWDPIIKEIMDNPAGHYEKSNRGERLQVYLKGMTHPDANALIKSTPTILSGVSKTNRLGFSGAPSKPRSDIYITLDYGTLGKAQPALKIWRQRNLTSVSNFRHKLSAYNRNSEVVWSAHRKLHIHILKHRAFDDIQIDCYREE